ncbi:glycoside hydrolase family 3 protein [bacterium]|nr:glycoside hydrolase family 3 protein [bacterium]
MTLRKKYIHVCFLCLFGLRILSGPVLFTKPAGEYDASDPSNDFGDAGWKSLSLREKIGQTMIINSLIRDHETFEGGSLKDFFNTYPVGGFFMADWYFNLHTSRDSIIYGIKVCIAQYAAATKVPLIFMEDYERGVGERVPPYTYLPVEMALGAAASEKLAYDYGTAIALESRDLGINWLLHPVADLNLNPLHPLVNERAVSDDPEIAIPLLKNQLAGLQEHGIIATLKHFPGDGATVRDQHLMTASNTLDWESWQQTFGRVFQALIDQGAAAVMVGHLTFPAYQTETPDERLPPSTLSKEVIQTLLKQEMGFEGVVISDAMNMGGAAGFYDNQLETAIACFEAGIDMILWPRLAVMDSLEARILRGDISMERLDDSVRRIWAVKKRFGLLKKNPVLFRTLSREDRLFVDQTARAVAGRSVTLIKEDEKMLPLTPDRFEKLLLVNISEQDKTSLFLPTAQMLEARGFQVETMHGLSFFNWEWRARQLDPYDKILVCLENRYLNPVGISLLRGQEAESVWMLNILPKDKIIAISYSNPYYVNFYFEQAPVLINAYSSDAYMQEAVVRAITGEQPFQGVSPVMLDHDILK